MSDGRRHGGTGGVEETGGVGRSQEDRPRVGPLGFHPCVSSRRERREANIPKKRYGTTSPRKGKREKL